MSTTSTSSPASQPLPFVVEYVALDATLADVAVQQLSSDSLRTAAAILLALLCILSIALNLLLVATVAFSRELRSILLNCLLAHLALVNVLETLTALFSTVLFVAQGDWRLGGTGCRVAAALEQFTQLYTLFALTLLFVERALRAPYADEEERVAASLSLSNSVCLLLILGALVISLSPAMAILAAEVDILTAPFPYRYTCAIQSGSSITFSIVSGLLNACGLLTVLISSAVILRRRSPPRPIPRHPAEYPEFIASTRSLMHFSNSCRLVLIEFAIFLVLVGPYVCLCFIYQIWNSAQVHSQPAFVVPSEVDTLVTWLKFLFLVLSPILIFGHCSEAWRRAVNILYCRCKEPVVRKWGPEVSSIGSDQAPVMTLVATADGLQLHQGGGHHAPPPPPIRQTYSPHAPAVLIPSQPTPVVIYESPPRYESAPQTVVTPPQLIVEQPPPVPAKEALAERKQKQRQQQVRRPPPKHHCHLGSIRSNDTSASNQSLATKESTLATSTSSGVSTASGTSRWKHNSKSTRLQHNHRARDTSKSRKASA